ncbi:MMPL family transporter [Butyrivibrio sp. WCD3002]|uniref:MMPL family transporter n=1 Tax=Butyrivibrio sp. WCD3002 TaxID=1280676 RepID=UPI00040965FF|nr:MMPL family transporter [Butyrivibrio sp. WCD3002]
MKNGGGGLGVKICSFIVDKRNLFFLIYAILCIFSVIARGWVGVENDLAFYLPSDSETRRGLDLMEEQFVTYGSVKVMVANISYEQGLKIQKDIEAIDGVFSCDFDDKSAHYNNGSALFSITFDYDEKEEQCLVLLDQVKEYFSGYDSYISTTLGDIQAELIDKEMNVISVLVVIIVVVVLVLTSQAYAEVPVLLLTFGSAALVQMGTNFLFGTISFVSNSVTIVLQLALSVDYAVIFLNRYKEEKAKHDNREACILALSKAIPEITGSSLTTMGGLIAMLFMQFGIGKDLGMVLIKAIILSLLSVFLLMPGIIMLFAGLMEETQHKNFIPEIPFVGKFAYLTRYLIAPAFLVLIIFAQKISSGTPYVYGYSQITPPIINDVQIAENMQKENFTADNMMALVFPAGDYDKEKALISELEENKNVTSVTGLANTEALGGYTLTDKLTPRQFSELLNIDYEIAELVYAAYALNDSDYAKVVNGLVNYRVPLIDMFLYVYQEVNEGYVTLSDELMDKLSDANRMMNFGKKQLQGEEYSRILVYTSLPQESDETFAFISELHDITEKYYDEDKIYVVGESVSQLDLKKCFARDNTVTSVISILAVLVVLLFTFKSAGMPVLLIAVIQGCIWINFSIPALQHDNLFFLGYLIVSSIQMGANIDYAIVIAGRYTELRGTRGKREAIIETMNVSFPTIITSGTMLAVAGMLIGNMTSDCAIYGIGKCLGRGTIISIFVTMFVLPQILLVGDKVIELTAFVMNKPLQTRQLSGIMRIDGFVRGKIDGNVTGVVNAVVRGNVSAFVDNAEVTMLDENEINDAKDSEASGQEGM